MTGNFGSTSALSTIPNFPTTTPQLPDIPIAGEAPPWLLSLIHEWATSSYSTASPQRVFKITTIAEVLRESTPDHSSHIVLRLRPRQYRKISSLDTRVEVRGSSTKTCNKTEDGYVTSALCPSYPTMQAFLRGSDAECSMAHGSSNVCITIRTPC